MSCRASCLIAAAFVAAGLLGVACSGKDGEKPAKRRSKKRDAASKEPEAPSAQTVKVTRGPAPIKVGGKTVATVEEGTVLTRLDEEKTRVKVRIEKDGKHIQGWIDAKYLRRRPAAGAKEPAPTPAEWGSEYPCKITKLVCKHAPGAWGVQVAVEWAWMRGAKRPNLGDITFVLLVRPKHPVEDLGPQLLQQMAPLRNVYSKVSSPADDLLRVEAQPPGSGLLVLYYASGDHPPVSFGGSGKWTFEIPRAAVGPASGLAVAVFAENDPDHDHMRSTKFAQLSNVATDPIGEALKQ